MKQLPINKTRFKSLAKIVWKSSITLAIIFAYTSTAIFGQTKQRNHWSDLVLYGKIKTLKETYYEVKQDFLDSNGDIQATVFKNSKTYTFNSSGNIIFCSKYQQNGNLQCKDIYKYDSLGHIFEVGSFNKKEIQINKYTFKCDSSGNILEEKDFSYSGVLKDKWIHVYDNNGNRIETNHYGFDGKFTKKETLSYNNIGIMIEGKSYNKNGKNLDSSIYIYDKYNHEIEVVFFEPKGAIYSHIVYKYKNDNNGNWIERITFNMDLLTSPEKRIGKPINFTRREIEYFE